MKFIEVTGDKEQVRHCFAVMRQLRPNLDEDEFCRRVMHQGNSGYRMVCVQVGSAVVAVAGFRIGENLAWGRFLYVDDLVTDENKRSCGYGRALLAWLMQEGRNQSCLQLHLDSGLQRKDAHRFYEREGVQATGYHFACTL